MKQFKILTKEGPYRTLRALHTFHGIRLNSFGDGFVCISVREVDEKYLIRYLMGRYPYKIEDYEIKKNFIEGERIELIMNFVTPHSFLANRESGFVDRNIKFEDLVYSVKESTKVFRGESKEYDIEGDVELLDTPRVSCFAVKSTTNGQEYNERGLYAKYRVVVVGSGAASFVKDLLESVRWGIGPGRFRGKGRAEITGVEVK